MAVSVARSLQRQLVLGQGAPDRPPSEPEDVLRFWFGRIPGARFGVADALWLPTRIPYWGGHWATRVLDVDAIISRHFGALHGRAARGELDGWCQTPPGALAFVILLDQMSRNMFRGTPAAFESDGRVRPVVEASLERGDDRRFNPLARTLFYLPLMHHEELQLIDRCVDLYQAALADARGLPRLVLMTELASARRHREIVARFGRYPHRNAILGRPSTPEEAAFLTEHFSSF